MALLEDLQNKIDTYFKEKYEVEETTIVPSTDYSKLTFGNKGLTAEFAFLFVDIRKSSKLHDTYGMANAARIYQSFHDICVRTIEQEEGAVRAFDGDRIMGVFSGDSKCTNAVKTAMHIKWAVSEMLNPKLTTALNIGCGVDVGKTLITKVGKGRDTHTNDLVWVGKACNYAAHLSDCAQGTIIISTSVYNQMDDKTKFKHQTNKTDNMWASKKLTLKNSNVIDCYESNWFWKL